MQPRDLQDRFMGALRPDAIYELDSGHSAARECPAALADVLDDIGRRSVQRHGT